MSRDNALARLLEAVDIAIHEPTEISVPLVSSLMSGIPAEQQAELLMLAVSLAAGAIHFTAEASKKDFESVWDNFKVKWTEAIS